MFQNFKKQNINFLEILFTPYFLVNEEYSDLFLTLRARANEIAHYNPFVALKCMYGMASEKFRKMVHISPASEEKIKQFGYDPKQLHHIVRLREFAERYANGEDFSACLKTNHQSYLLRLKEGKFSLSDARAIASSEIVNCFNNITYLFSCDYWTNWQTQLFVVNFLCDGQRQAVHILIALLLVRGYGIVDDRLDTIICQIFLQSIALGTANGEKVECVSFPIGDLR